MSFIQSGTIIGAIYAYLVSSSRVIFLPGKLIVLFQTWVIGRTNPYVLVLLVTVSLIYD